ncbi:MAG: glutamine amidotransferase family protein [Candidatus Omnitrophica bacterium]|nr:glutamine amidotransferase family protein [Candidatus Omnitrophota bacterium]
MESGLRAEKDISGCAISGIMDLTGKRFSGDEIISSISCMRERSNGLGGGFAAYGIYPQYQENWCFHMMFENKSALVQTEEYLRDNYKIIKDEIIPTQEDRLIRYRPLLWRYFLQLKEEKVKLHYDLTEEDFVAKTVMEINTQIKDAFVASSGKNMGVFKGVGYPEDIGNFYRLQEYQAYIWTAHGRFPTNTVGWWGGAHPFGLLDWTVVHNGEISSYGINKRFLLNYGYTCAFFTDTEVITYLFDLLVRKHGLAFETVADILAAPFWDEIDRAADKERELLKRLRIVYASALLNGPFSVIVANGKNMAGLNDRIKLRPLIAATAQQRLYISSEESAIRAVCANPDRVWTPKAGEPVIGRLKE